jgi:hypothetical protein
VRAVSGLGSPKRALEIRGGYVARRSGAHAAGEPSRDLLGQPRIAIGIGEGKERPVARALWVGTRVACLDWEGRAMPDVTHLNAATDELGVGGLDLGDDEAALSRGA